MQKLENRPNSIWIQIHTNILANCSATRALGGLSTHRRWTALINIFKLVQLIISPRQPGALNWNLGRVSEGVSDGCRLLLMGDLLSHFYKLGLCLLRQPVPHLLINSLIERISLAVTTWIERGNSKLQDELSHHKLPVFYFSTDTAVPYGWVCQDILSLRQTCSYHYHDASFISTYEQLLTHLRHVSHRWKHDSAFKPRCSRLLSAAVTIIW